jgi:hypothetical protein
MAIFYSAIPIGSALGYVVGGIVQHACGWRFAFFVAGGPGLLLAFLCLLIAEPLQRSATAAPEVIASARTLLRIPLYRGAVLGYCAYTFAIGGFAFWAPKYLTQAPFLLDASKASVSFGLMTVVGGFVGTLAGGFLADAAARRRLQKMAARRTDASEADDPTDPYLDVRANLAVCALSAGLGAPLAAVAIAAHSPTGFFAFALPCEIALFLSTGPVNVALLRSVPPGLRASAMALSIFAIHLLGDLWSPMLIGAVADRAPMTWAMMTVPVVFAIAALTWQRCASSRSSRGGLSPTARLT